MQQQVKWLLPVYKMNMIVLYSFIFFPLGQRGGRWGTHLKFLTYVCVCECEWMWIVEVLCENSVNVKSTSGVFLHNKRITDLSTSDCLVTLMHNLFVRVMGGREVSEGCMNDESALAKPWTLIIFSSSCLCVSSPPQFSSLM